MRQTSSLVSFFIFSLALFLTPFMAEGQIKMPKVNTNIGSRSSGSSSKEKNSRPSTQSGRSTTSKPSAESSGKYDLFPEANEDFSLGRDYRKVIQYLEEAEAGLNVEDPVVDNARSHADPNENEADKALRVKETKLELFQDNREKVFKYIAKYLASCKEGDEGNQFDWTKYDPIVADLNSQYDAKTKELEGEVEAAKKGVGADLAARSLSASEAETLQKQLDFAVQV